MWEGFPLFLRKIRDKVNIVSIKTNGTYPGELRKILNEWLVDRVELRLNGPVTRCREYCGMEINADFFIASLTSLQNWAGDQEIVFVVKPGYTYEDINMMADLLEGVRNLTLEIYPDVELDEETVNRFKVNSGEFNFKRITL